MQKFNKLQKHIKLAVRNFIIFLQRLFNLYLYVVLFACLLSWVPNINPDYPIFNLIFKISGFYIIKPIWGIALGPCIIMAVCGFASFGLTKLYLKYFKPNEPKIIVLTKDEFEKQFGMFNNKILNKNEETKKEDIEDIKNANDDK